MRVGYCRETPNDANGFLYMSFLPWGLWDVSLFKTVKRKEKRANSSALPLGG